MVTDHRCFFRLLLFVSTILLNSYSFAQSKHKDESSDSEKGRKKIEIAFVESSWKAALIKAGKENKYLFVDAYATWCGPCKLLKATTFKNKEVAAFFNQNFVNLSIDMEKGEGVDLSTQWEIQGYPTLLVFDASGKLVLGTFGFLKPKDLLKFGKKALGKVME